MSDRMDQLYYDGHCPLCRAEIARLAQLANQRLQLVDIHELSNEQIRKQDLPTRRQLLEQLHLRQGNGEWQVGLDANVAAWQNTRWGWLWLSLQLPLIRPLATFLYQYWAARRYQRLYDHCDGRCELP